MRKGLWSPDEDERLVRCITKYVNGSWSDIARKAGLDRCGKSCRRRWMNHLRPDLKRGKFSMEEINLIVQLQEALGNRWSDIASHLEGRTDNDVKNLWNTQIKRRLSQLKTQSSLSSLPTINFSSNSTHASCSTNTDVDHISMKDLANMGATEGTIDEYENGITRSVLRFGGVNNGNHMEYSCSASSCEGSDHPNNGNDQEDSSWKPNINMLSNALTLPDHAAFTAPAKATADSNNFLWTSRNVEGNLGAQSTGYDHSLLIKSCSSNIMNLGTLPFLQPSRQLPLLPADDDDRAMASRVGDLFHLQFQDVHQICTSTIASLESSSYVPVNKTHDSCTFVDDNEECCSLQHSHTIPSTANDQYANQMTKNEISSMDNLLSATADTINCNHPPSKIAQDYNDDEHLQQHNSQIYNVNVGVNMIYNVGDTRGIPRINEPEAAGLVPAKAICASADHHQGHSMWGQGQNQELHQLQSNYIMSMPAGAGVGAGAAGVAAGWDDMSEWSNIMPHFSFPEWCKQLLHMSADLL